MTATLVIWVVIVGAVDPERLMAFGGVVQQVDIINFYGKVVDTKGTPIPNAALRFEIRRPNWLHPLGIGRRPGYRVIGSVVTDGNGEFAVLNRYGCSLSIPPSEMPGYWLSRSDTYSYSPSRIKKNRPGSTPDNPMVIRLHPDSEPKGRWD